MCHLRPAMRRDVDRVLRGPSEGDPPIYSPAAGVAAWEVPALSELATRDVPALQLDVSVLHRSEVGEVA